MGWKGERVGRGHNPFVAWSSKGTWRSPRSSRERKTSDFVKVVTHLIFAECSWFATSAVLDVHYGTSAALVVAATSILPDADYPKSWLGHHLGSVSADLNRLFGHRSFLHSLLALLILIPALGLPLWWATGQPALATAVGVGYGSHLLADMMTL